MNKIRRFTKSSSVVERKVRGEHLLVPVAGTEGKLDSLYTLNATGSRVWELAIGGMPPEEICQALVNEFHVDAPTAERDVARLLDELCAIGALEQAKE